jgi:transposase
VSKSTVTADIQITSLSPVLMLAFELGEESWQVGFSTGLGQKVRRRKLTARDTKALLREINLARQKLGLASDVPVVSCYEAGRDGFWLHRFLEAHGIENFVMDSASIEVNRRKKRAKTDRLDVVKLVALLARQLAGEEKVFSIVSVPGVEEEDLRQIGRELKLLKKDRTRISNRMKGLLANQGLGIDRRKDLGLQLERLRLWNGEPLPAHLRERLCHYAEDFAYHTERIRRLAQKRRDLMRARESVAVEKAWRLFSLRGIGIESAWIYGTEWFGWREFHNGKQVGSLAGLTPTPFDSGTKAREQGIGKDGSRWVRGVAIEQAWAWLRFQPDSELSKWYERRFGLGSKRLRKIGIVALARKLLIALWHWVEHGVVPAGAVLKTNLRLV